MKLVDELLKDLRSRQLIDLSVTPEPNESRWQLEYQSDDRKLEVFHLDGMAWHDAPLPARLHRCRAQTRAWQNWFTFVERCACGSIRLDGRGWIDRNERRSTSRRG